MATVRRTNPAARVLFTCCPGLGHLYPLLALARALRDQGAAVMFLVAAGLGAAVTAEGFQFIQAGPDMDELLRIGRSRQIRMADVPPDEAMRLVMPLFADVRVDLTLDEAVIAARAWRPGIVASEHADFVGPILARVLDTAQVTIGIGPGFRPEWLTQASAAAAGHYTRRGLTPPANAGLYDQLYVDMWPPSLQQPGFPQPANTLPLRPQPFGRAGTSWAPPVFRGRTHRPLVVLTMGTIFGRPELLSAAVAGLAELDVNVLVTLGQDSDPAAIAADPSRVRIERFVPLDLALRGCDLVVTHGGAGTTLAALALGIPLVILPQSGDQFATSALAVSAGVAESIVPADFRPAAVQAAAQRILADQGYPARARRIRDEIAALPGPDQVAAVIAGRARQS
jgi:UDP:flavonoid glycosyltransferase YjiC (YdhE family)